MHACDLYTCLALGTAPVYFAAQEGRLDALRFLHTKAKCSLSTKNADGWSPIHAASQGGHAEVIEVRIRIQMYYMNLQHFQQTVSTCIT